jgi:hypothetical protein
MKIAHPQTSEASALDKRIQDVLTDQIKSPVLDDKAFARSTRHEMNNHLAACPSHGRIASSENKSEETTCEEMASNTTQQTGLPYLVALSPEFDHLIRFPDPNSISGKVLADMLCGNHVSIESMYYRYGGALGSNDIRKLREDGWPIERSEIRFPDPRNGSENKLALYYLQPATIAAMGSRRGDFLIEVANASQTHQIKGGV